MVSNPASEHSGLPRQQRQCRQSLWQRFVAWGEIVLDRPAAPVEPKCRCTFVLLTQNRFVSEGGENTTPTNTHYMHAWSFPFSGLLLSDTETWSRYSTINMAIRRDYSILIVWIQMGWNVLWCGFLWDVYYSGIIENEMITLWRYWRWGR